MDLISIFRIALRRWKIVVPLLLLTFASAAKLYMGGATEYRVTGTQLLMSGRTNQSSTSENAVVVAVDLLPDLLMQPSISQQLVDEGLSGSYELEVSPTGRAVRLEVVATSAEQAAATATALVELAPEVLTGSLGARVTERLVVEQATPGSAEDAAVSADGSFRYSTVMVVSTDRADTGTPFPASLGTVRLMTVVADSLPFQAQFQQANPNATYDVSRNIRESPILEILTSAYTPEEAMAAHRFVVAALNTELDQLQADAFVDPDRRTQWWTLVDAIYAVPTPVSRIRPVAAVTVLGSGLAIGLATVAEAVAADRRKRRHDLAATEADQFGVVMFPDGDETDPSDHVSDDESGEVGGRGESAPERVPPREVATHATTS